MLDNLLMNKKNRRDINGFLILDKPIGISSNRALQIVKRLYNAKKAGHTGSLDVLASGLLPLCFGRATKLAQQLLDADKYYWVEGKLGERTTTCDAEGEIVAKKSISHITQESLIKVVAQFTGKIEQIPSMYSALKHKGQPLYKLARKGIEVERKPRTVTIHELKLLKWAKDKIQLEVHCTKGTYIRNLIDDMGQALGCGAYVTQLRRLQSGPYHAKQMVTIEKLEELFAKDGFAAIDKLILPINS
jgi:tRNA pseudouridine55 synthase